MNETLSPVNYDGSIGKNFPKYVSHKEVWALEIKSITYGNLGGALLSFEDPRFEPINVTADYIKKHDPRDNGMRWEGGYYVIYEDGYKSWSPTEAFEKGYTLIK